MNSNYKSLTGAMLFLLLSCMAGSLQAQHSQSHADDAQQGQAQHDHTAQHGQAGDGGQAGHGNGQSMDHSQHQMMQAGNGGHGGDAEHGDAQGMEHGQCQMMQADSGGHGGGAGHGDGQGMEHGQCQMMQAGNGGHGGGQGMSMGRGSESQPTAAGQSGFAAIQEVVAMLEADPATDWSQVDLDMLRTHLIDMDRVMMDAAVESTELTNGMRHSVTGDADVVASIKRMVPAHVQQMRGEVSWAISMTEDSSGVELEITASEAGQIAKIKGLGFAGFMVLGDHHQLHHVQMSTGDSHQH